jgi:hypothetical protein
MVVPRQSIKDELLLNFSQLRPHAFANRLAPHRQQPRRKGTEAGGSSPEECFVLSDAERGGGGRPVHELDSHLSVVRRQLLRLTDRVAAPRSGTGDQARGVDAVELSRDAGADRLPLRFRVELG